MKTVTKPTISYITIMGDSLSDRGTLHEKLLFKTIPMRKLSGLQGKSPRNAFTNGLPWSNHYISAFVNNFIIRKIKTDYKLDNTDIADAIIANDAKIKPMINNCYHLKNDKSVTYRGHHFARTYTEGGLTARDYAWAPSKSVKRFIARIILSTLGKKRHDLLSYDHKHQLSPEKKAKTLIIEWSGANDLITVNKRPTETEAIKAIKERIKNAKLLIETGYRHFILCNLPDLSLTPRYQAKSHAERQHASSVCQYFNEQLEIACKTLKQEHPECTINIYDINSEFTNMFHHPEQYYLDKKKRALPYIKSSEFKMYPNHTSPAEGFMFWDDVHPTADVHAIFAHQFAERCQQVYHVSGSHANKSRKQTRARSMSFSRPHIAT